MDLFLVVLLQLEVGSDSFRFGTIKKEETWTKDHPNRLVFKCDRIPMQTMNGRLKHACMRTRERSSQIGAGQQPLGKLEH